VKAAFTQLEFDSAIFLTAVPGENRLVVVEQGGRIKVFDNDEQVVRSSTVLDISDRVLAGGEQGLLGFAFDPAFITNRYVYLNYSMRKPRRNVVSRMRWDDATAGILPASEKIILEFEQPYSNHNGGMLVFGPDDYLYIGVGDGGSGGDPQGHGQDRSTLLGNLLRLDVHPEDQSAGYAIPEDNPFVGNACCREEIFSYGWRNPYRFSFDRETGDLWVADVGQNAMEEINKVEVGANHGWNTFEGSLPFNDNQAREISDHVLPIFEYDHSQGSSITGGYVYRGEAVPSLQGKYIYADYVSGNVWALDTSTDGSNTNMLLSSVNSPSSFGETPDGEVLIVSHNNGLFKFEEKAEP